MIDNQVNNVVLRCGVGCLRHVIGITQFEPETWNDDEPELYFETLHEPSEGFWMRLWRAWQFVVQRKPMGADSTLVGPNEAMRLREVCDKYLIDYNIWADRVRAEMNANPNNQIRR